MVANRQGWLHVEPWLRCLTPLTPSLFLPLTSPHCSSLHFGPLLSLSTSSLAHRTILHGPSVPAPVLCYPFPFVWWSPPYILLPLLPSPPLSFGYISLGTTQPANQFNGHNPFSHSVFTGLGQVLIRLSLFLPSVASSLSLLCNHLLLALLMAHHILSSLSFTHLALASSTSHFQTFSITLLLS